MAFGQDWETPLPSARGSTADVPAPIPLASTSTVQSDSVSGSGDGLQAVLQQGSLRSAQVQQELAAAAAEYEKLAADRRKRALQLQKLEAAWLQEKEQRISEAGMHHIRFLCAGLFQDHGAERTDW